MSRYGWSRDLWALGTLAALLYSPSLAAEGPLDVRLNEVQVLGSHNSYHIQPEQRILDVLDLFEEGLGLSLEYTHIPLFEQFENQGIRQIELDVFADPLGGLYYQHRALIFFGEDPNSGIAELLQPGMKVLHTQDLDWKTTCLTLVSCLQEVQTWSAANPEHLPIMILIEAKDDPIPDPVMLGFIVPIPIGTSELDDIDAEIRSVFPDEQMITPDHVRGERATLEEAVRRDGWPSLREARGRVIFALDNGGSIRDAYLAGHPSLAGRVMFVSAQPPAPEAAFVKLNDPIGDLALIRSLVRDGFIIRTRADADTFDARLNDFTRQDAALRSGAQFVSSDYPVPDPFDGNYVAKIPGGSPARCNPINAPRRCRDDALENLTGLQPIAGRRLLVRDSADDASARKIKVVARDALIETPLPGSADDPSIAGALLEIQNPTTLERAAFFLPPGGAWSALGDRGWMYRDPEGANGPCISLRIRRGSVLRAECLGSKGIIPFSLDESQQGTLRVTLQLGSARRHCIEFGGDVRRDTSTAEARIAVFRARNAPPGGCPAP